MTIITSQDALNLANAAAKAAGEAKREKKVEDAAYLRGRSDAFMEVAMDFNPEAIYRQVERKYRLEDAAAQLLEYFGLTDEDGADAGGFAEIAATFGVSYESLVDPDDPAFLLDTLVERFTDAADCNVPENDTWQEVIREYIRETGDVEI